MWRMFLQIQQVVFLYMLIKGLLHVNAYHRYKVKVYKILIFYFKVF